MRVKFKELSIVLIYILMFISALSYMRFTVVDSPAWAYLHVLAMLSIIGIGFLYMIFSSQGKIQVDFLNGVLILLICYELMVSLVTSLFNVKTIVDVVSWPLLVMVFSHYSRTNDLPKCFSLITLCGITLVILFCFPNITKFKLYGDGDAIFTTYYSFAFLPILFLTCSSKIAKLYSFIVMLVMLLTLKRGAFLIVFLGLGIYYFMVKYTDESAKHQMRKYLSYFMGVLVLLIFVNYLIEKLDLNILLRLQNSLEDSGSGRLMIWDEIIWEFTKSSFIEKVFGHGFHSVFYQVKPLGIARYAHNSFVETLYDYGIVGLILIIYTVVLLMKKSIEMLKIKSKLTPIMFYSLVPMLILGLVSYFFEEAIIIIPISVVWGVCLGRFTREKNLRAEGL